VRNPLESLTEAINYRNTLATVDTEGELLHGQAVIRKIFATWIPAFAGQTAARVNAIQLGRFATPPRRITFATARRSGVVDPHPGACCRVSWYGNQDEAGNQIATPFQIVRVNPLADRIEAEAEEMIFKHFDVTFLAERVITIDSRLNNVHLPSLHNSIYPPLTPTDIDNGVTLKVIIASNVVIGSGSIFAAAFNVGSLDNWLPGLEITLEIRPGARIQGMGGNGGYLLSGRGSVAPQPGGPALLTSFPVTIINGGAIWAGGGGGGHGASPGGGGMGGGGAGFPPGAGGPSFSPSLVAPGSPGTAFAGGPGGVSLVGRGGDGGGPGLPGFPGTGPNVSQGGAAAGFAIHGIGFITFVPFGDIRGLNE
jgi:hypothetical protein